jgi:hypothetical protein
MPVYMPPGTITNFGTFNKNLQVNIEYVDGYPRLGKPKREVPIGMFVFNAIVEDAIMAYGGAAMMATTTGTRLARLASIVLKSTARAAKAARTAAQGTKVVKQATKALKNAKTAVKKAIPKSSVAKRAELYKAQGYHKYTESTEVKEAFAKLEELAEKNKEFREVLNKVYDGVKRGTQEGIKAKNARLRMTPGWDHSEENEKYVFDKYNITPEFLDLLRGQEEYKEPEIISSKDFYYKQDLEERERVRRWRAEGKLTFAQPTYTKEEKLANEERQAIIDRQNKLLAMQITGRDENYNYILPTKENLTPKVNTQPNTQVNTQPNTQVNTQPNTQVNTQPNTRTKYQSDYTQDNRDYNNFNFGNNRPIIDNDWLNVNSNNVNNIDSEKLQNFVENE